jgi:hypothetical protein
MSQAQSEAREHMLPNRPLDFRTAVVLGTLLGVVMGLLNHFVVLSSDKYSGIFG